MVRRFLAWSMAALTVLALPAPLRARTPPDPAAGRRHWAYQPVHRPAVPAVQGDSWVRTPIDAFVLARLEQKGIQPAPPADRRTLLRRVYLDLIGLPPTPEEQEAFLADPSPDAYARVVDNLLARPQYGERWARHWLDVARYADTNGYERDGAKPSAWRYRDYVIDAFNRDKPYDRFLTEQLAGDELADTSAEAQIATTFLRLGTWDDEPAEPKVDRYDQLDDVLGTTATAFLGVTLRCARCHDHKFEPFTQADYYRMLAAFEPLKRPQLARADLDRPVGGPAELAAYREGTARADAAADAVQNELDALKRHVRDRLLGGAAGAKRTRLPEDAVAALQAEPAQRSSAQKALVKKYTDELEKEIREAATVPEREQRERLEKQLAVINAGRPRELPHAYIWYEDGPEAPVSHVLHRGDPTRPRQEVGPGVPAVLARQQPDPPRPLARSTGRRLWLARWLTSPDNPLTARVLVNRLWQHHFGKGIVASANDFGVMGDPPTHPELLDWLAAEFMAGGWHIKALQRTIVLSSTYQTAGAFQPEAARVDPKDALLWRWRQRRLEAEAVRDSILAVSGRLNLQAGGPGVYPPLPRAVLEGQSRPGDGWGKSDERQVARRSVYIFVKRSLAVPELEVLDAPDTTSSCEARPVSTIAPQALTFLNGEFINEQARQLATRLEREAGGEPQARVRRAFELTLCRPPRPEELQASLDFLTAQQRQIETELRKDHKDPGPAGRRALEAFCLAMLNTSEFVYVD
jgi:hypothetical protein